MSPTERAKGVREASRQRERERALAGLVGVAAERGYRNTTVGAVIELPGLDEDAFRRQFDDLEDCLCGVLRAGTEELMGRVLIAYSSEQEWRSRLRAVAYALLAFLQEDPKLARVMTVEVLSAGERAQLVRDQGMQALIELIDVGRQELEDPKSLSRATAEAIGGAIYSQMHLAIEQGELDRGAEWVPRLMYNAVLPYLGSEAAQEELHRPPPERL